MSFIKKIFNNELDESIHNQFVRFGKGDYPGRALLKLQKKDKIKLSGSYEYVNDFVNLVAELDDVRFSGMILSKTDEVCDDIISEDPDADQSEKRGLFVYVVEGISKIVIELIKDKIYFMLLDAEALGISLKIKKRLPKPGKSGEAKIDDKFCQLEIDLKYWQKIKDSFFWDISDCKKAEASHEYIINDIIIPENEKDFEKIRLLAKRKGKIIRKLIVDKREEVKEKDFMA